MKTYLIPLFFSLSIFAGPGPGEFEFPDTIPLSFSAVETLRHLIKTDPEAAAITATLAKDARPLLGQPATPLEIIHYEGIVNTDPRRIETVKSLKQMGDAALLVKYWQASGDPEAKETLLDWSLAWMNTYRPDGNDVNENKLFPLLVACYYFQEVADPEVQKQIQVFAERLGPAHVKAVAESTFFTNLYTKHVRLAVMCGLILDKPEWVELGPVGVKKFVEQSLYADGSSRDLKRRDTLTYHNSALRPPIQIAMLMENGEALYVWENQEGGSLKKSVDFVVPYSMGTKTREEWTNSKSPLDHERAAAGIAHYQHGIQYDPQQSSELMELASYFDPDLMTVVLHLSDSDAKRFPTWQTLVNAAVAESRK